ncbi:MAG: cbb3-type cytochrome c oxidase subunit I, partial [Anaerolineales bacterium]|nr:cbb3-type cytochrome c oxidase subunit I [Anaerolineales bacterium]
TTFFIMGFFVYTVTRSLKRELSAPKLNVAATIVMVVGLVAAAVPILLNLATVLFTFYPPMKASPYFYLGLALVIVGSWMHGWGFFLTYRDWRKENPKEKTPLIAFGSIVTMAMWQIATLGVAIEVLVMLIPFAFGLTSGTDPQLARTFFWFFGHPVVYFWLLPVYVAWYGMVPKQAGGKLFSDSLARIVFWMFLVLIPTGIHHQYTDPGVPSGWKVVHAVLTFSIFFPSLITAFTVIASLEVGGRARGGKGLFGWIRSLPWDDPSYTAHNLAMILFAFGGISGITNASYNLNTTVHNTIWVPGHFHLTVGSAVTLSFFGIIYWMLPSLINKPLWSRKLALWQCWTWFTGMILMSNGLHILGLNFGAPRRSALGTAPYVGADWQPLMIEAAIGGIILGISGLLFYINIVGTAVSKERLAEPIEMPVAEPLNGNEVQNLPAWIDSWRPWLIATAALILIAYVPVFVTLISQYNPVPGFKVW